MKLWLKQTLICLLVIMLTFGGCIYFFVAQQTNQLLNKAQDDALLSIDVFCEHLTAFERTIHADYSTDETTRRALIHYIFSSTARLLQSQTCSYSLVADNELLYNIAAYQPMILLPGDDHAVTATRMTQADSVPLIVCYQKIALFELPVTVYTIQNISATIAGIDLLTGNAQLSLAACLVLSSLLLLLTLRRTLTPLQKLTQLSEEISGGHYALRSHIHSQDEIGELSASFDHMAETIEQKIRDLEEQSRRRELLMGALTHEMKTPMTAIIGFSDSLLFMPLTEEKRMENAYEIHEAAFRIERLSQKMMQLITMMDGPVLIKCRISADDLCQQVCSMMREPLDRNQLKLDVHLQTDHLQGDADLLICLLTNLIDNAIKASKSGQPISLTAAADNHVYSLSVCDHGIGIPADKIALVTEPFFRVDKARSRTMGGAGLGLSLCQMIAQAHSGQLHINSILGQGTTITMTWPAEDHHE